MNAWVAVSLGVALWFFVRSLPFRHRPVATKATTFWRFVVYLGALGYAAHWWTP